MNRLPVARPEQKKRRRSGRNGRSANRGEAEQRRGEEARRTETRRNRDEAKNGARRGTEKRYSAFLGCTREALGTKMRNSEAAEQRTSRIREARAKANGGRAATYDPRSFFGA